MAARLIFVLSAILVLAQGANIRRADQEVVVVQSGAPVVLVSPGHQRPNHNRGPHSFPVGGGHRRQGSLVHNQPVAVVVPVAVPVAPIRVPAPIVIGSGPSHRHQNRHHNQRPF